MYAVIRKNEYDVESLARYPLLLEEFNALHACQPGFLGSLSVDLGDGVVVLVDMWESEAQARKGLSVVASEIRRLSAPLLTRASELVGAGRVVSNDLVPDPEQSPFDQLWR